LLVLINQSRISDTTKANLGNFKKMVIVGNYLPDGLDYAQLTALESLSLFDGTMTDAMRSNIQNLVKVTKKLQSINVKHWGPSIATNAFAATEAAKNTTLRELKGFEDVTTIGNTPFIYCCGLVSVSFPKVVTVGDGVFRLSGCALTEATLSDAITSVGHWGFRDTRIRTLRFVGQNTSGNGIAATCSVLKGVNVETNFGTNVTDFYFTLGENVQNLSNTKTNPLLYNYIIGVLNVTRDQFGLFANKTTGKGTLDLGPTFSKGALASLGSSYLIDTIISGGSKSIVTPA
jgi:hypothetical protein